MTARNRYAGALLPALFFILVLFPPALASAGTVGVLMPGRDIPYYEALHKAMTTHLQELSADAEILLQRPAPAWMAWKNATRKLVVFDSEVIVAYGSSTALAVISEAEAIPLVYCAAYDPVGCGIGSHTAGVEGTFDLAGLIKNLKKISHFKKLAILYSHEEPDSGREMDAAKSAAEEGGATVREIETHDLEKIDLSGSDAVLITSAANINSRSALKKILAQAESKKIATAALLGLTCEQGVLISRYVDPVAQGREAAKIIARVLEGAPVSGATELKTSVETAINISTAKKLGLSVPFELLGSAKVVK